jgi:Ca2+-binding RTX toxin-like protein
LITESEVSNVYVFGYGGTDWLDMRELAINCELKGGSDVDIVIGGLGGDIVWGEDGNDYLYGGPGNDYLKGVMGPT